MNKEKEIILEYALDCISMELLTLSKTVGRKHEHYKQTHEFYTKVHDMYEKEILLNEIILESAL